MKRYIKFLEETFINISWILLIFYLVFSFLFLFYELLSQDALDEEKFKVVFKDATEEELQRRMNKVDAWLVNVYDIEKASQPSPFPELSKEEEALLKRVYVYRIGSDAMCYYFIDIDGKVKAFQITSEGVRDR